MSFEKHLNTIEIYLLRAGGTTSAIKYLVKTANTAVVAAVNDFSHAKRAELEAEKYHVFSKHIFAPYVEAIKLGPDFDFSKSRRPGLYASNHHRRIADFPAAEAEFTASEDALAAAKDSLAAAIDAFHAKETTKAPYKSSFFKPYKSKLDFVERIATIISAPIALALLAGEKLAEFIILGLKSLVDLALYGEFDVEKPIDAIYNLFQLLLMAFVSPLFNGADVIGSLFSKPNGEEEVDISAHTLPAI